MGVNGGFPQNCPQCEVGHEPEVMQGQVAVAGNLPGGSHGCASDSGWPVLLALVGQMVWRMGANGDFPLHCQQCQIGHKLGVVEGWMARG